MPSQTTRLGFTLAEVLITLGIIGVVAALTIPPLIQSHRKHVVETSLKKFYSEFNQAVLRVNEEYGYSSSSEWRSSNALGLTPLEWWNTYLGKYIETLKVIEKDDGAIRIFLKDGSVVEAWDSTFDLYPNARDVDGCKNRPAGKSCLGTKLFEFVFWDELIFPYRWRLLDSPDPLKAAKDCCYPAMRGEKDEWNKAYCAAVILYNNWTIPKDYPAKF